MKLLSFDPTFSEVFFQTSYALRLSVRMPMAPKEPGKSVKLCSLCVKSLRARASLLVQQWTQARGVVNVPAGGCCSEGGK